MLKLDLIINTLILPRSIARMHQTEDEIVSDVHVRVTSSCPSTTGACKANAGIGNDDANTTEVCEGNDASRGCLNEGVYAQKYCRQSSYNYAASSRKHQHEYIVFESYQERMNTFTGWPCSEIIEPLLLAEAGFFYAGFNDCARCFSCGGGLINWTYGDRPWVEHARLFPGCLFLREHKGQEYINQIRDGHSENYDNDERSLGSAKNNLGERYGLVSEPDIPEPNLIYRNSNYVLPEETTQFAIASSEAHSAEESAGRKQKTKGANYLQDLLRSRSMYCVSTLWSSCFLSCLCVYA